MRFDLNIITENYRKIIIFLFIALIALACASITGNLIAMVMDRNFRVQSLEESLPVVSSDMFRADRTVEYYSPITERNIFDSQNRQPSDKESSYSARGSDSGEGADKPVYNGPPVKSSMNATLVGTMVFSDPAYSFAKISRGSGGGSDTGSFYIGDSIFGEATVKTIERNRVYIERDGRKEYLEIEGARGTVMPSSSRSRPSMSYPAASQEGDDTPNFSSDDVKSLGGNKFLLNKKMLDGLLSNYNAVLTQARAVPNFEDGKTNGFKIFAIKDQSIYSAIGIKNGDVLTRVNGQDINNLERVLSLFTQLRNESNISIDLVRGGQKMTYEYNIR